MKGTPVPLASPQIKLCLILSKGKKKLTRKRYVDVTKSDVSSEFGGDQFFRQGPIRTSNHGLGYVPTGTQYRHCNNKMSKNCRIKFSRKLHARHKVV